MPADPPYRRIAEEVAQRIRRGELQPGQLAPSARQITREWGVAIATATRVLAALRELGLVRSVPGVGTVVQASAVDTSGEVRPARRRAEDLSSTRIVAAAIAIADTEGLAAVSARRVAAAVGVATMSLYRHVPGKEELVLLMADAVLGERAPAFRTAGGWLNQVEAAAREHWLLYRRHRWLASVISLTRPQPLPHGMAHTDALVGTFLDQGLDPETALHCTVTVFGYVRGMALNLETQAQDEQDTGLTDSQWMQAHDAEFEELFRGQFPNLFALSGQPISLDLDSLFEFGLRRLLEGLAAFVSGVRE